MSVTTPHVVRPATSADIPALGRLGAQLVRVHHAFDPQRFMPAPPRTESAYGAFLESELEDPDVVLLVAERDGDVLGYTYSVVQGVDYTALRGPAGTLHDIVVDPAAQREGVGHTLLDATLAARAARGVPRVVLSTAGRNEAAQRPFAREESGGR